ncbi:15580_t:CDS:1, partial [Gigaspora margarita]
LLDPKILTSGFKNFTCFEMPKSKSVHAKKDIRKVLPEVSVRVFANIIANVPANISVKVLAKSLAKIN